jgi:hypothetical protein
MSPSLQVRVHAINCRKPRPQFSGSRGATPQWAARPWATSWGSCKVPQHAQTPVPKLGFMSGTAARPDPGPQARVHVRYRGTSRPRSQDRIHVRYRNTPRTCSPRRVLVRYPNTSRPQTPMQGSSMVSQPAPRSATEASTTVLQATRTAQS